MPKVNTDDGFILNKNRTTASTAFWERHDSWMRKFVFIYLQSHKKWPHQTDVSKTPLGDMQQQNVVQHHTNQHSKHSFSQQGRSTNLHKFELYILSTWHVLPGN